MILEVGKVFGKSLQPSHFLIKYHMDMIPLPTLGTCSPGNGAHSEKTLDNFKVLGRRCDIIVKFGEVDIPTQRFLGQKSFINRPSFLFLGRSNH